MLRRIGLGLLLLAAASLAEDPEIYKLRRYGLSPTYESLRAYLRALYPGPGVERALARFVTDLGDPSAEQRDHAIRELHRAGASAATALARGLDSEVPEVVRHARWLLASAQELLDSDPMYAAYMTIARRRIRGLTGEVVRSLPLAKDAYVRVAGRKALVATATREDAELLRAAARHGESELRAAAVRALAKVLGDSGRPELRVYLADRETAVRYAAAMALADLKDSTSLGALVALLDAASPQLRYSSVMALRRLSGKRFGYAAYAAADKRAPAVMAWKKWVAEEGATVEWAQARNAPVGLHNRILVVVVNNAQSQSELLELDLEGTVIWSRKILGNIQGVQGLANGHRLVSLWGRRIAIEYDRRGNEVWRSPKFASNPGCVQRLVDGTTMICFPLTGEILEVSPRGETIRTLNVGNGFYFAERLVSGITRVGHYQQRKIIDFDRHGRIVRQTRLKARPFMVRKLEDGNMLVALHSAGRVEELGPRGTVVRSFAPFANPTSAFRIANGITLVCDRTGVWRIDRKGRRRQIFRRGGTLWISYY